MSDSAIVQVEIEKELRRQLLEVDEHSSHQGRLLERLQEHTVAMHALAPGMPPALPGLYTSFCTASSSSCDIHCILSSLYHACASHAITSNWLVQQSLYSH